MDQARGRTFVGREAELARLARSFERAATGDACTVLVAGEAGIGKTRLVDAFARDVRARGGRVVAGGCLPVGAGGVPYGPLVEALRTLFRDVDAAALPALLGPGRADLGRLMPEVGIGGERPSAVETGGGGRGDVAEDRFAQVRLFELVLGVLERLARVSPVVLVIDDLQWADPSTRELVGFLVRNLRDERVLLIATVRTDESDPGGGFLAYLAGLERGDRIDRVDLARFGRDELMALMSDELGTPPDAGLVDRTLERSGGNPFFAEQLLAVSSETTGAVLPARLRDVLLARVAAASETCQEILRVASAAGGRVDDDLLTDVSDLGPASVREGLREAIDRRILVSGAGEPGANGSSDPRYVFSHALLREVVHASLLPGERTRLHARYAEALERRARDRVESRPATGPPPTAGEIADQWEAAGDDRRALAASVEAGQAAERGAAFPDAHRRYRRALDLWEAVPDATAALDRPEVLVRAAETAVLIGDYRTAVTLGEQAIGLVDAAADPARAASLQERQRWYLWEAGDHAAAAAAVEAAERLVPTDPPSAARSRILAHHAGLLMTSGRLDESIPYAEEAIVVARAVGSRSDEALALGILGWDLALLGRVEEGVASVRAGLAIADELGGTEGIALGASNLATLLDRVGRAREALDVAREGWERVRVLGVERTYGGQILAIAAKAAIALGSWDEADGFLRLGLARPPLGQAGLRLLIQRCRLDTFRGDLVSAAAALSDARAAEASIATGDDHSAVLAAAADLAVAEGRVTDARAAVAEGLGLAAAGLPDPALATLAATALRLEADLAGAARARRDDAALRGARARVEAIAAQVERVAAMLAAREDGAGPSPPTRDRAVAALCRAEVGRFDERDDAAMWATVAATFEAIERPYPAAYARYRAA
ncbi:MAG: ATP-binding protein, partial [Chloroflexota bacterium]